MTSFRNANDLSLLTMMILQPCALKVSGWTLSIPLTLHISVNIIMCNWVRPCNELRASQSQAHTYCYKEEVAS